MGAREGAQALQQARLAAGLTQEELAERSGVSERTIRSLESGRAIRPHRATLLALAAAAGLDAAEGLAAAWRTVERSLDRIFETMPTEEALRVELERQRRVIRERVVTARVVVGADRRWRRIEIRRDFEIVGEEVDTFLFGSSMPLGQEGWTLDTSATENAEPLDSIDIAGGRGRAILLSLGDTYGPGETSFVRYGLAYGPARSPDAPLDCDSLFAVAASVSTITHDIVFHPDALPRRVCRVEQDTVDGPPVSGNELRVSPFGVAHVMDVPVSGAVHGIRWEW